MRMFVALVPPEPASEDLAEFLGPRQETGSGLRWTLPEQWHVTLAFLAAVPDRSLDDLLARLDRAAHKRHRFDLAVAGGGAFPNVARARVLYGGIDAHGDDEELRRLATGSRAAGSKAGADAAGGRFHPHLTLARLGRPAEVTRWVRVLDSYRGPVWTATEVTLIASHLGEGPANRPRYETVGTFPLRGS